MDYGKSVLMLASCFILCASCMFRPSSHCNSSKEIGLNQENNWIELIYEQNAAPWIIMRYIGLDAEGFIDYLNDPENMKGSLIIKDSGFFRNITHELNNSFLNEQVRYNHADARIIILIHHLSTTDTVSLQTFPHFPYEYKGKFYTNPELYCLVWERIYQQDSIWRQHFNSCMDWIDDEAVRERILKNK